MKMHVSEEILAMLEILAMHVRNVLLCLAVWSIDVGCLDIFCSKLGKTIMASFYCSISLFCKRRRYSVLDCP